MLGGVDKGYPLMWAILPGAVGYTMHTITHGTVNALIAYLIGLSPFQILIVVLAGTLIDLDHSLYYLFTYPKMSWREIYQRGVRHWRNYKPKLFLFHTVEFNIILLLFALIDPIFLYISLGIAIHLFLDAYDYMLHLKNVNWAKYWLLSYYIHKYLEKKGKQARKLAKRKAREAKAKARALKKEFRRSSH